MSNKFQVPKIIESIVPFVIAGIAIALFIGLLFMFSYVVIWGLMIGGVLWLVAVIKQFLFPSTVAKSESMKKTKGRVIEHDDKK